MARHIIVDSNGWGGHGQENKIVVGEDEDESSRLSDQLCHSLPYVKRARSPSSTDQYVYHANCIFTNHRSMENVMKQQPAAMVRPPLDVLATYVNTSDKRALTADLLDAHEKIKRLPSRRGSAIRPTIDCTASNTVSPATPLSNRETSGEWGWFADIDSSSESLDVFCTTLRRKYSTEEVKKEHVLCDETDNTRITAAHKTFAWADEEALTPSASTVDRERKIVSAAISIPKFRIVQAISGADRHAEYQVTLKLGNSFFSDWRRYSEFSNLVKAADANCYPRTHLSWKSIDTRWFNRLEPSYLHRKCIALENFIRELMYESLDPTLLLDFLGGARSQVCPKANLEPAGKRASAQLPKDKRPPQPEEERELFEKLWAENFKRSQVSSGDD